MQSVRANIPLHEWLFRCEANACTTCGLRPFEAAVRVSRTFGVAPIRVRRTVKVSWFLTILSITAFSNVRWNAVEGGCCKGELQTLPGRLDILLLHSIHNP